MFAMVDYSLYISILAIITASLTFYFTFLRPKRAKIGFTGPFYNPSADEWGTYIINVGRATTLLSVFSTKMQFGNEEYEGKIRPEQETYLMKYPNEYYLCWVEYLIHDYENFDWQSARNKSISFDVKYFNGRRFKRIKKKLKIPQDELSRFYTEMVYADVI